MNPTLLVCCQGLLAFLLATPGLAARSLAPLRSPSLTTEGKSRTVEVRGSISEPIVVVGNKLWFFISVSNETTKPVFGVRLRDVSADGFEMASRCWCDSGVPCDGAVRQSVLSVPIGAAKLDCELIAARLDPGQSIAVSGVLLANRAHAKETLVANVSWSDEGKALSGNFTTLGGCVIQTGFEQWRSSSGLTISFFAR